MLLCQLMNDAKEVEVNYSSLKPIGKGGGGGGTGLATNGL
jgi:hypothetical protein